jgi:hypothetical protein
MGHTMAMGKDVFESSGLRSICQNAGQECIFDGLEILLAHVWAGQANRRRASPRDVDIPRLYMHKNLSMTGETWA